MVTILFNGHQIEAENTWSAKEIVRYDGRIVSERRSISGGSHFFEVQEDGYLTNYEVTFNPLFLEGIGIVIRRNGVIIFSSDRRIKPPKETISIASSSGLSTVSTMSTSDHVEVKCPYCNHRNYSEVSFCVRCGASI